MTSKDEQIYLEARNIEKVYPVPILNPFKPNDRLVALKEVNLKLPEGSVCCVLGPNGAGKTTLIKILADLILPDKGEILRYQEKGNRNIGLVTPNDRAFYWRLTGRQNLAFFASLCNVKDSASVISAVLDEVGLSDDADKPYRQYSAGMKQKLNLARALISKPSLYLLDEPANHLDPLAREDLRTFIKRVLLQQHGATVLLCTHDLEEASELADYIILLHKGKVLAQGDPSILKKRVSEQSQYRLSFSRVPEAWVKKHQSLIVSMDNGMLTLKLEDPDVHKIVNDFVVLGGELTGVSKEEIELMNVLKYFIGEDDD